MLLANSLAAVENYRETLVDLRNHVEDGTEAQNVTIKRMVANANQAISELSFYINMRNG